MSSNSCPVCAEGFSGSGAARDHAWDAHGACHYCGDVLDADDREALYRHWLLAHPDELTRADEKRAEAEVDSLTLSDRFERGGVAAAVGGVSRRKLLLAGGVAGAAGLAVAGSALTGGSDGGSGTDGGSVATAPVPPTPSEYRYATAGTGEADAAATYFGNWKCPFCAQFSEGLLGDIVTDYVAPGDLTLTFRHLAYIGGEPFLGPDAPAAGRAGLAVWNEDPDSYWPYHETVFGNQPPENQEWATPDRLVEFARTAGVSDPEVVRTAVEGGEYQEALEATTTAANEAGIRGTPALVVGGTAINPMTDEDETRRLIENAISNG